MLRQLALILLAAPAVAGTVSHTVTVPTLHNFDSVTVQVPGFDHNLGHLDSVTFTRTLTTSGTVAFENVDPWDTGYFIESWVAVDGPAGMFSVAVFSPTAPIGAFDGTLDYAGTSGIVAPIAGSQSVSDTNFALDFDALIQPTVTLTVESGATVGVVTPQTWQTEVVNITNDYTFTITYNYSSYPESFCNGGGIHQGCPCGTTSPWPFGYGCLNSQGTAGSLWTPSGLPSLSGTLSLQVDHVTANTMGLLFEGTQPNYAGVAFGDGVRCVGGTMRRLGVQQATQFGNMHFDAHGLGLGYRAYQVWYRDVANFCGPAPFNLTNAVGTVWTP